jgi:hypothetical protein
MPCLWVTGVRLVYRDGVAILADYAGSHFVKRAPALAATLF